MQTTIIDVKFDEKFKSEVRIGLPCKEKLGNCKNLSKNEGKVNLIRKIHNILKVLRAQSNSL